jgi:hypothetical protein
MRHHLTSLHESIWDIVEFGAQAPQVGDEDYDSDEAAQIRHFNSQATSILLASLCREEYNKVQGLKNAKEIWDILKTAHQGDEVIKITKSEMIEGELGRFVLNKGEETQAMYNWLKTMGNQVRNLESTKWDDHEMVKVILRSLVFRNPTQVQLIHGDPRYKQMSPEEVIGKFVIFELMIKDSKHIVNLEQGATSTPEAQPVAFKATEEKKEEPTPSRLPIDASKLDNEEMALIIKSFRQILKQKKGKDYKPRSRLWYMCGKSGYFIAKCPYTSDSDRDDIKKGKKKMEKKRYYNKKNGGEVHMGREWDSDESSTDYSSDEDAINIAVNKGLLFSNVSHKCLIAKDNKKKKVYASDRTSWIIDSGCTNHLTGEKRIFSSYEKNGDPQRAITFEDGNQGLVKGLSKIAISQLCKMGYNCLFTDFGVLVFRRSDDSIAFKGVLYGHLYLVDFNDNNAELDTFIIAKTNMGWLWHHRLAHIGMKNLHKLLKGSTFYD